MAYEKELIDEMLYPLRMLNKLRKEGKFPSRKQTQINAALNWIEAVHPYPGYPSSEKILEPKEVPEVFTKQV